MNKKKLESFKQKLLVERERILNNSKNTMKHDLALSKDDLPDEADLASAEISQSLVMKLRDRERILLSKIDGSLERIDAGDFGVCDSCEEDIEEKRLKAQPFSVMCISCQESEEKREKLFVQYVG